MALLLIEALQALLGRLGLGLDVEGVLGDHPGDDRHPCRTPRKHVHVASKEVDELVFLFRVYASPKTKAAPTASSPEACRVAISSSSLDDTLC
jgi:hypothetical protein